MRDRRTPAQETFALCHLGVPRLDEQGRVGDMRHLDLSDGCLVGVVLFYAIVHCDVAELTPLFQEARRVLGLRPGPRVVSSVTRSSTWKICLAPRLN
jgi:hypothetical protein